MARRGFGPERDEPVVVRPARPFLELGDDAQGVVGLALHRVRQCEPAAHVHRDAVELRRDVHGFEHHDGLLGPTQLEEHEAVRPGEVGAAHLHVTEVGVAEQGRGGFGIAVLEQDVALHDVGDALHPFGREELDDVAQPLEAGFGRLALSELGQRADDGRARLGLAPAVADLLEPLHGLAAFAHRVFTPTAPQRDVGEQHVHHADGPAVAGRAAFDRDLLRELGRFVEPALHVAHECEQPERPAEPAPVAELAEQLGRLLQAVLRGAGVAA